jgi:hypothetical protein
MAGILASTQAAAQLQSLPTPPTFEPHTPLRVHGFDLGFRGEASLAPTSNVRLNQAEDADTRRTVVLSGNAASAWQKHNLMGSVDIVRQDLADSKNKSLNNNTFSGSLLSRWEIGGGRILRGGVQRQETIIGHDHVDQLNGFVNGVATTTSGTYGIEWENAKYFVSLMGQHNDVTNDSELLAGNALLNQSLDRNEDQATLQAGRRYAWGSAYAFAGTQGINYEASGGASPDRDSEGHRFGAGLQFMRGNMRGSASMITFSQDFDTPLIDNLDATVGTLDFGVMFGQQFAVTTLAQRAFAETNIPGIAGVFTNTFFIGGMYAPKQDLYFKLGPSYNRSQLAGNAAATKRKGWDFTSAWQVNKHVELTLGMSYVDQTANDSMLAGQVYDETSGKLALVLTY